MIVLHQFAISPFCDKVRRILQYKKLPYETREVPTAHVLTGQLRKRTGTGKVPFLEDDGHKIADSSDIARYLDERYPTPPIFPSDPSARARAHVLEDWADESLYFYEVFLRFTVAHNAKRWIPVLVHADMAPIRAGAPMLVPRTVKKQLDAQGIGRKKLEDVLRDLDRHLDAVDGWLGDGKWLVGDALSIADISVYAQLFCVGGAEEGARAIGKRPRIGAWMKRLEGATAA